MMERMAAGTSNTDAVTTPEEQFAYFHERRELAVRQPLGSLALTTTQLVELEQPVWGVPGMWAPRPAGESGLTVTATAADGVTVDGETVDGTTVVRGQDDPNPSELVFSDTVRGAVITQAEGGYALRVWDAESDAIQAFGSIQVFAYDPAWVVTAQWRENPANTTLGVEHVKEAGTARDEVIPGTVAFSHDGVDYELVTLKAGRALQIVFADLTNGDTSYSVGRFLFVAPNSDGTITLDFNRAVLPPCAFSYAFNCPIPPQQNRFAFAIEAGERNVLNKEGALLHG